MLSEKPANVASLAQLSQDLDGVNVGDDLWHSHGGTAERQGRGLFRYLLRACQIYRPTELSSLDKLMTSASRDIVSISDFVEPI